MRKVRIEARKQKKILKFFFQTQRRQPKPMEPPTTTLLKQLDALHASVIFPNAFNTLQWYMVAAYEVTLTRTAGKIFLDKTTFWVSPDKNPKGQATIEFDDASDTVGDVISNELFTAVCGSEGDQTILIGYCKDEKQVEDALRHHKKQGNMKSVAQMRAQRRARTRRP